MSTPSPDLSSLRAAFCGRLLTDPADTAPFLTDWRKRWTGRALAVAQPDATDDVARQRGRHQPGPGGRHLAAGQRGKGGERMVRVQQGQRQQRWPGPAGDPLGALFELNNGWR